MKKYVVIGGQYASYCYGSADTLVGAMRIASKNMEHWDNHQGWHYPSVYLSDDVEPVNNFYGSGYAPKADAEPVAVRRYGKKWEKSE